MATKNKPSDSARHDENRAEDDRNRHGDDEQAADSRNRSGDGSRIEEDRSRPDPEPLAGLIGFERDLLFTVARLEGSNPHGVAVREELEAHYGEEINQGRLYQNLRGLVDADRVHTLPLDGRTKVYRLTDRTREELAAHLDWQRECLADDE
ncbi:helix-turn-helix transcriptional regulator [Halorussus salinus]|uniref:helix-turn-helix transcriptional regulator n=1 Tax=Halorussus salinus TaxID=1364935 RepID=UPI0010927B92|nr:helix-turn-helix transcriptional regulator [Halorussus salinus]